jgi:hypothetical protein
MTEDRAEKRRFPRLPSENTVLVKKLGTGPLEEFAKTRVVGLGGCSFASDTALEPEARIEMYIAVSGKVVMALARVADLRTGEDGKTLVGVEFLEISPEDREVLERLLAASASGA